MKKIVLLILLLSTLIYLQSLEIHTLDGNILGFAFKDLAALPQCDFSTISLRGNEEINHSWKGIELQGWLSGKNLGYYHGLSFVSSDAYEIIMHRADLDTMQVFIALYQNDNALKDNDLRLIFPSLRERFWVRSLQSIRLLDYTPAPRPYQIKVVDSLRKHLLGKQGGEIAYLDCVKLLSEEFHTDEGSLVILDANGTKVRLDASRHLNRARLFCDEKGLLNLIYPGLHPKLLPHGIIYLQSGPFALIEKEQLPNLKAMARSLNWGEDIDPKSSHLAEFNVFTNTEPNSSVPQTGAMSTQDIWLLLK